MEESKKLLLEVVTPYHHFYEGKVSSVVLSSLDGNVGIYPGHEPMVIALTPGITHFKIDEETRFAALTEGYAEVGPHMVLVVCNAAEWPEEIDVPRAQSALERSIRRYHDQTSTAQERLYARHSLRRAKMRLKLAADQGTDKQKELLKK